MTRILVRAGETVSVGDVIARLINPQVRQTAVLRALQLAEATADHRRRLAEFTDEAGLGRRRSLPGRPILRSLSCNSRPDRVCAKGRPSPRIDYRSTQIRTDRARGRTRVRGKAFEECSLCSRPRGRPARRASRSANLPSRNRSGGPRDCWSPPTLLARCATYWWRRDSGVNAGAQIARVVDTALLRGLIRVAESYASRVVPGQRRW